MKLCLIIAVCLVLIGLIIFVTVMTMHGWDFTKLSTQSYETNTHILRNNFNSICIDTDSADVSFAVAEDGICKVVCYELSNSKHSVDTEDGCLVVKVTDTRKWYEHIGIGFSRPKITVCLPHGEYGALTVATSTGNVKIPGDFKFECMDIALSTGDITNYASTSGVTKLKTSTGGIRIENTGAESLDLSVSTGKVAVQSVTCTDEITISVSTGKTSLNDIRCKNIISIGRTGDVSLNRVIASETFSITRSTGDVTLSDCDASEIFVKTDTGDVRGTLLSEKVFIIKTSAGDVSVPETVTGGKCEISTDTGDIKIGISG